MFFSLGCPKNFTLPRRYVDHRAALCNNNIEHFWPRLSYVHSPSRSLCAPSLIVYDKRYRITTPLPRTLLRAK